MHHMEVEATGVDEGHRKCRRYPRRAVSWLSVFACAVLLAVVLARCAPQSRTDERDVNVDGSPIESLWASYTCGEADSPWVWVIVNSTETVQVVGQLWVRGEPSRLSHPFVVGAGRQHGEGLYIIPADSWGKTAELRIFAPDRPSDVLAMTKVRLQLPPGRICP